MIRWEWDPAKAESNLAKQGVSFELAVPAIDDPFSLPEADGQPDGDRWCTTGKPDVGSLSVLVVVHTDPVPLNDELVGRVISARPATRQERKRYEEG